MVHSLRRQVVTIYVTLVLLLGATVAFSVWTANRATDIGVCGLVLTQLNAYNEVPPQTPAGKNLQHKTEVLYESQCK